MALRYWGEKGIDYEVDENGYFYRTAAQREAWGNDNYLKENSCDYTYFPAFEGMLAAGINTVYSFEQPGEYYDTLSCYDKRF